MNQTSIAALEGHKHISLRTRRKNGKTVDTPVQFAKHAGKVYVITGANTGKVKRVRNFSEVQFAPCNFRGQIQGEWMSGTARIFTDAESDAADKTLAPAFGSWYVWLSKISYGLGRDKRVYLEITPIE